jgi:hypothetical protein
MHPGSHRPQLGVNLSGRASHDQAHESVFGNFDVLESAQDVNVSGRRRKKENKKLASKST